jgi:hypothetical protein
MKFVVFARNSQSLDQKLFECLAHKTVELIQDGQPFNVRQCTVLFSYFEKFVNNSGDKLSVQVRKIIHQQINTFLENCTKEEILQNIMPVLSLAAVSSHYLTKYNNPKIEAVLKGHVGEEKEKLSQQQLETFMT